MLKLPQTRQVRSRITLIAAAVVGLLACAGAPTMAAGADVQRPAVAETADNRAAVQTSSVSAESATYAQRQSASKELEQFKGGDAGLYIGGSTAAVVLLIVLVILIL